MTLGYLMGTHIPYLYILLEIIIKKNTTDEKSSWSLMENTELSAAQTSDDSPMMMVSSLKFGVENLVAVPDMELTVPTGNPLLYR